MKTASEGGLDCPLWIHAIGLFNRSNAAVGKILPQPEELKPPFVVVSQPMAEMTPSGRLQIGSQSAAMTDPFPPTTTHTKTNLLTQPFSNRHPRRPHGLHSIFQLLLGTAKRLAPVANFGRIVDVDPLGIQRMRNVFVVGHLDSFLRKLMRLETTRKRNRIQLSELTGIEMRMLPVY